MDWLFWSSVQQLLFVQNNNKVTHVHNCFQQNHQQKSLLGEYGLHYALVE